MKSRRNRAQSATINVTPLVDVLLILLVIVMLAMPVFVKRAPVDLPQTSFTGVPTPQSTVRIYISDTEFFLDGQKVNRAAVLARITASTSVELGAAKAVTYEQLMQLMAEIQSAGPREVSLLTY